MEVDICLIKFKILLEKIFNEEYEINTYYTEKLLKYLEVSSDDNSGKLLLENPVFSDVLFKNLENIQNASASAKVFFVNLVTILFKNELQFSQLKIQGFQMSSITYCILENLQADASSPALHLACIKAATAQISHCSGVKYILEYKLWECILYPEIEATPIQIRKAAYNFISKLVWKLNEFNKETDLIEIIRFVVEPITKSEYNNMIVYNAETEKAISDPILRSLNAMLTILNETEKMLEVNKLILIFRLYLMVEVESCATEPPLHKILTGSRDPNIISLVIDINFRFYIGLRRNNMVKTGENENYFCNEVIAVFLNSVTDLLAKIMVIAALEYVVRCNIYWSKLYANTNACTFERNGEQYEMHNQFLMPLIVPLLMFATSNEQFKTESVEQYIVKLGKLVIEHVFKIGHTFKTLIERSDLKKITIHTLKELFNLKGHLEISQVGLLFQSLYYVLVYVSSDEEGCMVLDPNQQDMPDNVKLLSLLLDALMMLLKEHKIHWYENVEIICLQNSLLDLLKKKNLPNKQVLQVLDLIDMTVKKFLSPDMALLVESKPDSTLSEIGIAMKFYIQHDDWELRDSALNLLLTCTDIAFVKYVPMQKIICENHLIILASQAAFNDPEFYTQAMALKCLAAATKVESIWREVLTVNRYIYVQLGILLRDNPEGMVRKEAANVLTQVYVNQKMTKLFENYLYDVMTAAALKDLHWEVQLASLNFWKHVIQNHLSNRGMMDGKFPKITFSREKRKIVVLDEKEIKTQLSCILKDLSSVGCLTALHNCMKDDSNIEVMEHAFLITKELIEILNYYSFENVPENELVCPMHDDEEVEIKVQSDEEDMIIDLNCVLNNEAPRERVIDSILNTKQSDLLMNLSEKYAILEVVDKEFSLPASWTINLNRFLRTFKETDHLTIIKSVKEWNLGSCSIDNLFDEILENIHNKINRINVLN